MRPRTRRPGKRNISMNVRKPKEKIDIGDRLIAGILSVVFSVITLAVYLFILVARAGRASEGILRALFSGYGLWFVPLAFIVGFFAGPRRLADGFSFLWGTHPKWKQEPWSTQTLWILLILLFGFVTVQILYR